jgi:hypothetical protein
MFHRYNTRRQAKLKEIIQEATRTPTTFEDVTREKVVSKILEINKMNSSRSMIEKIDAYFDLFQYLNDIAFYNTCSIKIYYILQEKREMFKYEIEKYVDDVIFFSNSTRILVEHDKKNSANLLKILEDVHDERNRTVQHYHELDQCIVQFLAQCNRYQYYILKPNVLPYVSPLVEPSVKPIVNPWDEDTEEESEEEEEPLEAPEEEPLEEPSVELHVMETPKSTSSDPNMDPNMDFESQYELWP